MNTLGIRPTGDLMRYWVRSQSDPAHEYLVDVMAWECPCLDCQIRVIEEKTKPWCIHLERALIEFAIDIRKQIVKDQKEMKKK